MSAFTKDEEEKNEKKTFVIKLRKRDFSFYYYNNTLRFELCPYILLTKTVLGGGLRKKNIINITQKTTFLFTIYLRKDTHLIGICLINNNVVLSEN